MTGTQHLNFLRSIEQATGPYQQGVGCCQNLGTHLRLVSYWGSDSTNGRISPLICYLTHWHLGKTGTQSLREIIVSLSWSLFCKWLLIKSKAFWSTIFSNWVWSCQFPNFLKEPVLNLDSQLIFFSLLFFWIKNSKRILYISFITFENPININIF